MSKLPSELSYRLHRPSTMLLLSMGCFMLQLRLPLAFATGQPQYPKEYLLDYDYIEDSSNPLEKYALRDSSDFDCAQNMSTCASDWPATKKDWCSTWKGVTCKEYDCEMKAKTCQEEWSQEQKAACAKQGRSCPEFDCNEEKLQCQEKWSKEKTAFCAKQGRSCPEFDCNEEKLQCQEKWSKEKSAFCARQGNSCKEYDCKAGKPNCLKGWSDGKKAWCSKSGAPCVDVVFDCSMKLKTCQEDWTPKKKRACAKKGTSCPEFDCDADKAQCQDKWPNMKKVFCARQGTVCEEYDCKAGYRNCRKGWSESKKAWCERNDMPCEDIDCSIGLSSCGDDWSEKKKLICARKGKRCQSFDCDAEKAKCDEVWSNAKKAFCKKMNKSCQQFDCAAGTKRCRDGWSKEKKQWCSNKGQPCEEFDCNAGKPRCVDGWSAAKKAWCASQGLACKEQASPTPMPTPQSDDAKATYDADTVVIAHKKAIYDADSADAEKTYNVDSTVETACLDLPVGWTSSDNTTCEGYFRKGLCMGDGRFGPGWRASFGTFANWAPIGGLPADKACCACGGGRSAQEVAEAAGGTDTPACVTRKPIEEAWLIKTASVGTPCMFGVDDRDEGKHCIMEGWERYGQYGWCWTKEDKTEWGSCIEKCPLFGQWGKLAKQVDKQMKVVSAWKDILSRHKANASTSPVQDSITTSAEVPEFRPNMSNSAATDAVNQSEDINASNSSSNSSSVGPVDDRRFLSKTTSLTSRSQLAKQLEQVSTLHSKLWGAPKAALVDTGKKSVETLTSSLRKLFGGLSQYADTARPHGMLVPLDVRGIRGSSLIQLPNDNVSALVDYARLSRIDVEL